MSQEEHGDAMNRVHQRPNMLRGFMLGFLFLTTFGSAAAAIAGFSFSAFAYPVWIAITAVGTFALSLVMIAAVLALTESEAVATGTVPAQPARSTAEETEETEEEEDEEEDVGGQPFDAPTPSDRDVQSPDAGAPTPSGRTPPGVDPDDLAGYTGDDGDEHVPDEHGGGDGDDVPTPSGN